MAMLNPQVALKNTLLDNATNGFVEELKKIALEFPKSMIKIGYTESLKNPADFMNKLFCDPCKIINSQLYRVGDPKMKTTDDLDADTIGTCMKGEFQFLGIPERFLKNTSEDKCYNCMETSCALINLVTTRARGNRESLEDKKELEEAAKAENTPVLESTGLSKMKTWNLSIKRRFQINNGECLIDPNYKYKSDLVLNREEYEIALSKHHLLNQLLRFLGWLAALDIAQKAQREETGDNSEESKPIDLKKEAAGILFRTSQKIWKIKENPGKLV